LGKREREENVGGGEKGKGGIEKEKREQRVQNDCLSRKGEEWLHWVEKILLSFPKSLEWRVKEGEKKKRKKLP